MDLMYAVAGVLTGFVIGLTGVGGGALMTPILLLIFGIAPTTAVATDLWFASITKLAAVCVHHKAQQIEWVVVRRLWLGSIPAVLLVICALLCGILDTMNTKLLPTWIGCAVLLSAMGLLFKQQIKLNGLSYFHTRLSRFKSLQFQLTVAAGSLLGIIVALTSVGAGVLGGVVLIYLYPSRLTPQKLVGTDIAHAIPVALIAGSGYLIAGHVNTHLLYSLLLGSVPATVLGSLLSTRFSQSSLRICLVTILSFSALKLIFV